MLAKSLFYIYYHNQERHFLICNEHKQLVSSKTWKECSIIHQQTNQLIVKNATLNKLLARHELKPSQLHKAFYDVETFNTLVKIDKTKYYEESIVKACNDILK